MSNLNVEVKLVPSLDADRALDAVLNLLADALAEKLITEAQAKLGGQPAACGTPEPVSATSAFSEMELLAATFGRSGRR